MFFKPFQFDFFLFNFFSTFSNFIELNNNNEQKKTTFNLNFKTATTGGD